MRQRVILIVSVGLNVALAAALVASLRHRGSVPGIDATDAPIGATGAAQPKVVVRKQFFSWQQVESEDYPQFIKNLRDIDCPEQTIRDIIVADVNQLFARKRLLEIVTASQQWWRADPDPGLDQAATAKFQSLEQDRRTLLTTLLGSNWEQAANGGPPRPGIVLNGLLLGDLSPEIKQSVLDISTRSQQRTQAYLEAQAKAEKKPDLAEVARIRLQTRNELAQILNPAQLEEFLLRYSQSAATLRRNLHGFEVTQEEFRKLFRASDPLDQQIALNYAGDAPITQQQRATLERQREEVLKATLGADRYEEYRMAKDPAYRDAVMAVEQAGAPSGALANVYAINQATAQELDRIRSDPNLTAQQKADQLKAVQAQQQAANDQLLGFTPPTPPPPLPNPMRLHAYVPGETVDVIANNYGVSPDALRAANPSVNFTSLPRGVQIKIPKQQGAAQ
ncbi:MAG: Peptidoglycan-binding LysM [Pedosphaera sp.]|nr:Peptidoglycan-binding LysM [Pedosphaera sp.]